MADWIAQLIGGWPFWAVISISFLVWIIWIFDDVFAFWPWRRKEWWQDREKRLKNEIMKKELKAKAKKG